jgi:hypothetical protein
VPSDIAGAKTIRRLEMVKLCTSLEVQFALQCSIVTFAADHIFQRTRDSFTMNPGNTLPYMAIRALEERSIVHIAEALKQKRLFPEGTAIRKRMDLIMHRHSLSHPLTIKWNQSWMQEFFDQRRMWRDLRPALVWDMQRSINDEFRRYGVTEENDNIYVTTAMAMCLELILKLSMRTTSSVPSLTELQEGLQTFKDAYLQFLVENLDGQRQCD